MTAQKSGKSAELGVFLEPAAVRLEMQRRGWQVKQLSAASNLSAGTIRRILRGYPCFGTTLGALRKAFEENPPKQDHLLRRSA